MGNSRDDALAELSQGVLSHVDAILDSLELELDDFM
jgi:hypothetical protein